MPAVVATTLLAFGTSPVTAALALGAARLPHDGLGWRVASAAFDRERLVTR